MLKYPVLFLCLISVGYLLMRDCRRRASVSAAVWIPILFLLIIGSRPVSVWLGDGATTEMMRNSQTGNLLDQAFFFSAISASLMIAVSRRVQWGRLFAANAPLMIFYGFFAMSIVWSGEPVTSAKRLIKDFGMLFIIAVIISERKPLQAIRAVYFRTACILFPLSAVTIKWFPNIARDFTKLGEPIYSGVTLQKNSLGEVVLVFSIVLIWDCLEDPYSKVSAAVIKWDRVLLLTLGVWLLYMSKSETSMICLLLGSVLILRRGWLASKIINAAVLIGALALPYSIFFSLQFNSWIHPFVDAMGRNMTFTGRTEIWRNITYTTVNPFIGAGFWNFWDGLGGLAISEKMHEVVPNAHCGYLDIYVDGGVIGLVLLFSMLIAYGRRLMKGIQSNRYQAVRFAILIVMIVYNLSESMYGRISPIWFTTLLVFVGLPHRPAVKEPQLPAAVGKIRCMELAGVGSQEWAPSR